MSIPQAYPEKSTLTFIGHATVLIEMDGQRLLTDPVLRNELMHLRRRNKQIDPAWSRNINFVLISHPHMDHMDLRSLRRLGREIPIIAPQRVGEILRRRKFSNVHDIAIGETISVGPLEIQATNARHEDSFGYVRPGDCLGYIIRGTCSIYFSGDTEIFPEMSEMADQMDVALLPVWGFHPKLKTDGHMDPYQAAQALKLIQPRLAVPIHWGTLHPVGADLVNTNFLSDPPHDFANYAAEYAPQVEVHILRPGETLKLPESLPVRKQAKYPNSASEKGH